MSHLILSCASYDNIRKKQFWGVSSPGLKWENKTYKLKRSIFAEGVTKKSFLTCCNSAESSVLITIMQQTGRLVEVKTDSTNLIFYPSTFVIYPTSILTPRHNVTPQVKYLIHSVSKWLKETGAYSTWKWSSYPPLLRYDFCFEFLPLCLSAHGFTNNRHLGIWSPLTKFSFLLRCQEIYPTVQLERKLNEVFKINPIWIFKCCNRRGSWELWKTC